MLLSDIVERKKRLAQEEEQRQQKQQQKNKKKKGKKKKKNNNNNNIITMLQMQSTNTFHWHMFQFGGKFCEFKMTFNFRLLSKHPVVAAWAQVPMVTNE
jgi:hypothetical protein